jgi:hypothetical protein
MFFVTSVVLVVVVVLDEPELESELELDVVELFCEIPEIMAVSST